MVKLLIRPAPPTGPGPATTTGQVATRHEASHSGGHTRGHQPTAQGYAELVEFANNHATLRAWAIEGTGGHGAGLSRHLLESSEIVIDLDRPKRAARRNGAKSDPLDAIRAGTRSDGSTKIGNSP